MVVALLALTCLVALSVFGGSFTSASSYRWVSDVHEVLRRPGHTGENRAPGCILFMDDRRFNVKFNDLEKWGDHAPFWLFSRVINRAYADRHGYRFILAKAKDYASKPPRAASWYKIRFAKAQLQCCCQWVFFIDSDAYFRMNGHDLSIESWLHRITEPTFFNYLRARKVNMTAQSWFPQPPKKLLESSDAEDGLIALFPRNGDSTDGACGGRTPSEPDALFFEPGQDSKCFWGFINAGQFMLRNSTLTHKFLDEWFNDPNSAYYTEHPWEQLRVNEIAYKYKENMIIVPFRELTGHGGQRVRHYWRDESLRQSMIKQAMVGLLTKIEAQLEERLP